MSVFTDIGRNENGSLKRNNGDFVEVSSDEQHIKDILLAEKGWFVFSPLTGVGLTNYLNSPNTLKQRNSLKKKINIQLRFNGFKPKKINVNNIANPIIEI